jgi:hypothetical protein
MTAGDRDRSAPEGAGVWAATAFCGACALAGAALAVRGAGEKGTVTALMATARLSFLFFAAAYTGGPLAELFGSAFRPLRRRGRELGLAFAAAHLPHLGLVAWLCWIGHTPAAETFAVFGAAAFCTYGLALASLGPFRSAADSRLLRPLRPVAMNYIAFAFAVDFLSHPLGGDVRQVALYLPFAAVAAGAPALRFAALCVRALRPAQPPLATRR